MLIWKFCERNVEGQSPLKTDVSGPGPMRAERQSVRYLGYEEHVSKILLCGCVGRHALDAVMSFQELRMVIM
jgi:hypothetical protein